MKNSKQLVSVSGMYRTGSSALIDIIRGAEESYFVNQEFKIFESGLYEIIKKTCIYEFENHLNAGQISNLTQEDLFGAKKKAIYYGKKNILVNIFNRISRGQINALREKKDLYRGYSRFIPNYEFATQNLFNQFSIMLADSDLGTKNISEILSAYFDNITYKLPGSRVVFNQLIKADHKYLPEILPHFRILVVRRDPRDHFCEIINTPGKKIKYSKNDRAAEFIREYKKRLASVAPFESAISKNVMVLNFEELALDFESVLVKLKNFLEFEKFNIKKMNFNKDLAVAKVAIYKKHSFKWEIDEIELELGEYLV